MFSRHRITVLTAVASVFVGVALASVAEDHERHRRGRHREHSREQMENAVPAVDNPTYQDVCGACHFPLPPGLLPARSWQRLLAGTENHFGQQLGLEAGQLAQLDAYLTEHAAERTASELAQDILRSVGSSTPLRVTDVPEIRREHRRLDQSVFERPDVAGRADCPACHRMTEAGIYSDDTVEIPRG